MHLVELLKVQPAASIVDLFVNRLALRALPQTSGAGSTHARAASHDVSRPRRPKGQVQLEYAGQPAQWRPMRRRCTATAVAPTFVAHVDRGAGDKNDVGFAVYFVQLAQPKFRLPKGGACVVLQAQLGAGRERCDAFAWLLVRTAELTLPCASATVVASGDYCEPIVALAVAARAAVQKTRASVGLTAPCAPMPHSDAACCLRNTQGATSVGVGVALRHGITRAPLDYQA